MNLVTNLLISSLLLVGLHADKPEPPAFSTKYIVQGTLYIPFAEIREPFYAWYDQEAGASRIDYYGGMVKTYQKRNYGDYGTSIKVAPVTTETELNSITCLQVNGSESNTVLPQSIIPDISNFKYAGTELINGLEAEKWRLEEVLYERNNKYTMWVRYKKNQIPIPVRYEMRGYNSLLGSHYDHYYMQYEWFNAVAPDPEVFELDNKLTCVSFPGPGDKHLVTFNPMQEFVRGEDSHVHKAFNNFKDTHERQYHSHHEHLRRKEIFRQNYRYINSKNRAGLSFELGVNHLADRTDQEIKALRGRAYSKGPNNGLPFSYSKNDTKDLPESIDWRLFGAVTPVKDQSVCGSCWSYGTTGSIEGAYFVKNGKLVRFSQQALIDCTWGYGNNGCDGGEEFRSYEWMMKHGGLPTEDEYGPYLGQDGYCHLENITLLANVKSYVNVTSGDENALRIALVKNGPIAVGIDASHKTFSFYTKGIYYDPHCGNKEENLDHAVLLVGYGKLNGEPYWLIKNSWSTHWGNDGYVLMSPKDNNCGVATDATYVNLV